MTRGMALVPERRLDRYGGPSAPPGRERADSTSRPTDLPRSVALGAPALPTDGGAKCGGPCSTGFQPVLLRSAQAGSLCYILASSPPADLAHRHAGRDRGERPG